VWVATDDERIAAEVDRFGGRVVMTSPDCANGTERCAEAMRQIDSDVEFVVNLQGDAPLTPVELIPALVGGLERDSKVAMATPVVRCSAAMLEHLRSDEAEVRVGGTTAVFSRQGRALYFSKRILPYVPEGSCEGTCVHLHLGVYAYHRWGLKAYEEASPSPFEQAEGLEQLRFLDLDLPVLVIAVEPTSWAPIELNNPSDVPLVERELARRGVD
jgi:3-deoxy-manno-octulosonate cytidylyltransferase (CMP-KDO synthetase)